MRLQKIDNINIEFFNRNGIDLLLYEFTNIYETDNVICFTQPKVGSRTLDTLWKDKNYSALLGIEKKELYWHDVQMRGAAHDEEQTLRFEKTLNNILFQQNVISITKYFCEEVPITFGFIYFCN